MKRPELYHCTVSILEQAYLNDVLEHGNCYACVAGNIIAHYNNYKLVKVINHHSGNVLVWNKDVVPYWFQVCGGADPSPNALDQIKCTGYSAEEIKIIENAFECADYGSSKDEWMFNGLCAVIDALDVIHENPDATLTEYSKKKFTNLVTDLLTN